MKKLAVLLLTATLALSLPGCGNGNGENGGSQESSTESVSQTGTDQESQPTTDQESQPGTDQESQPGTDQESQTGTDQESQPESDQPSADPSQEGISEQMGAIRQAVVDALGDNYWPDTLITAEDLEGNGLTSEMYTDFWGEMPMISANVDTIIIIKAAEGQLEEVQKVLNSYRDAKVNDTMQYPMNIGKIQASQVETVGDYVCFLQLGADTTDLEEEDSILHCQEQNGMALEAIKSVVGQ